MAIAEMTIVIVGGSASMSEPLADVIKLVDASGLRYHVGPMGTVVQGDADSLISLFQKCHKAAMGKVERAFSTITIDERKGADAPMDTKVKSIEKKLGKKLN